MPLALASRVPSSAEAAARSVAWKSRAATLLFVATTFGASALLFVVQPMFARMALPSLGGSPAVWTTCMLFFQMALMFGYAYTHVSSRWFGVPLQSIVQVGLLALGAVVLPLGIGHETPPDPEQPVLWLLGVLTMRLGPPFLVLSTMAPMLQRWYASLPDATSSNPYFLYASSNAGSLIALLAYPFLIEPLAGLRDQAGLWTGAYLAVSALVAVCAAVGWRSARVPRPAGTAATGPAPTPVQKAYWVLLSAVPSSLLLGVTTHISTDLASIPLLWVLPLAVYLSTFILAFGRSQVVPPLWVTRGLPGVALAVIVAVAFQLNAPGFAALHIAGFFVAALSCHLRLAASRPPAQQLTGFYLWMSLGGVVGGAFNSLVAPHLFTGVFEYPLALALACGLRASPRYRQGALEPWGLVCAVAVVPVAGSVILWAAGAAPADLPLPTTVLVAALLPAALLTAANRTAPFNALMGLAAIALCLASSMASPQGQVLVADRSFFGVSRVLAAPDGASHLLQHGSTLHGRQHWPPGDDCRPLSYYTVEGPAGDVMRRLGPFERAALVGLGSGALACYAPEGGRWTFFEIDPLVERVARTPAWFTYLAASRGTVDIEVRDGRRGLDGSAPGGFDLIVLDAFSSDSVPVHLLTREALGLYFSRLRPGGVVAVHVSNRYVDLEPVLAATLAGLPVAALTRFDDQVPAAALAEGRTPSQWVAISAAGGRLDGLRLEGWRDLTPRSGVQAWTDDYSNLVRSLKWR